MKKFEVVNDKGAVVMHCTSVSCIPDEFDIESMARAGYKFKIDGNPANKKKIKEIIGSR